MDEKGLFLNFWKKEANAIRKVIARVPEGSEYRPDPKSRTARELAWLIVREEAVLATGLEKGILEWEELPAPATMKEILAYYDERHDRGAQAMATLPDSTWARDMPFTYQGHEVYRGTGHEHAWTMLFDIVHHRGQLSTYLRPMGSTVPQIYGPSADEPM